MKSAPLAFLALAAVLVLGGCASTDTANVTDPNAVPTDANGNRVSTQPWNNQTSWEQGGAMGAMMGN